MAEKQGEIFPKLNNGALVDAMNALKKNETPKTRSNFVAEAVKASYFSPVDLLDADGKPIDKTGKVPVPKDAKFNFRLIRNSENQNFLPVFTDITEFQKWSRNEKVKTIVVTFPQMANLTLRSTDNISGIAINPLGHNLLFRKEVLEEMARRAVEEQQAQQTQEVKILLGKPLTIPDSVLDSFRKTLAKEEHINAVYFLMMKRENIENYLFVFDIDLDNEEGQRIAEKFKTSAQLFLSKYPIMTASINSQLGMNAPNVTEPFYKKA